MMHTHWPLLWLIANAVTGISYVVIAAIVYREGGVRPTHYLLYVAFVAACGGHHIVHAVAAMIGHPGDLFTPYLLDAAQLFADVVMAAISLLAAVITVSAYIEDDPWTRP